MIINHNITALNSYRQLTNNNVAQSKSLEKLSSGMRINRAGDDAAGLAISEKMRGQIRGLTMASKNSQDGISLIQTAEGALGESHSILQRMRELAVQAANDTNATADKAAITTELTELKQELTRISTNTSFNTQKLLDGTMSAVIQVGANSGEIITISVTAASMSATGLAVDVATVDTTTNAQAAITLFDNAIATVSTTRASMGAKQNRLEHTISNLDTAAENLQAAESRIRDVDMAKEMMNYTKNNILNQASTAMLAQANQAPQGVLQLLK